MLNVNLAAATRRWFIAMFPTAGHSGRYGREFMCVIFKLNSVHCFYMITGDNISFSHMLELEFMYRVVIAQLAKT